MKCMLLRKEKSFQMRNKFISSDIEFYEETKNFHTLFIFPKNIPQLQGEKLADLLKEEEIKMINLNGQTFKIDGNSEVINKFAPSFIEKGYKVKLENPDTTLEIHKWGNKYIVSVS